MYKVLSASINNQDDDDDETNETYRLAGMIFQVPMTSNVIEIRILFIVKRPNDRVLFRNICMIIMVCVLYNPNA